MNIRTVENAIIEKLKLSFPEILVEGFPDKPSEFILLHQIGALLVHYQGSNYTSTQALECFRLQGFPDDMVECGRKIGLVDGHLYKMAGNAVTVNVIESVARKLAEVAYGTT